MIAKLKFVAWIWEGEPMLIGIRLGRGVVNIEVPDQNLVAVLDIQPSAPIADSEANISKPLAALMPYPL